MSAEVLVCRSKLDSAVWWVYASSAAVDLTDLEHPGKLRAVQRYAAARYAGDSPCRWERVDADTYRLVQGDGDPR